MVLIVVAVHKGLALCSLIVTGSGSGSLKSLADNGEIRQSWVGDLCLLALVIRNI